MVQKSFDQQNFLRPSRNHYINFLYVNQSYKTFVQYEPDARDDMDSYQEICYEVMEGYFQNLDLKVLVRRVELFKEGFSLS